MSKTIDSRVVEMRFDNKQFENNVQTSLSTIEKLKRSLNMDGAAKGLDNINSAAKNCNMSGISGAVETVRAKFSALEIMAVTALSNIANSAVNVGKKIVSALTIDPIKTGFQEYETQINAVQTILANTSSKGTTLDNVNAALDELNHYADLTIYNFTEMTRNIGTFTAAGIDLDTSVSAIKGIANLAAVSGSTSQQASTAMYQLSQALASGTVKLQDWNSVVNAGMGGQVFQDALKETARVHGIAIDEMITDEGSFRETLQNGWLTSEILTETLEKFTGDLNESQLKTMGYTDEQIKSIIKMGQTANDAATKVKTFTQLFDTLAEAAQSGWTQSWEIIIGDFEEAKELLTEVSDVFSGIIGESADARNKVLEGWKDLGGRTAIIDALKNAFEGVLSIVKPVKEAFREIFPPISAKQLVSFSEGLRDLTAKLKLSDTTSENLKRTFKGMFAVLDIAKQAFSAVLKAVIPLFGGLDNLGGGVLSVTAYMGDGLVKIRDWIKESDIFGKALGAVSNFIKTVTTGVKNFIQALKEKFSFSGFEVFHNFLERVHDRMSQVGKSANGMKSGFVSAIKAMGESLSNSGFLKTLQNLWNNVKTITGNIVKVFGELAGNIIDKIGNANFDGLFDILNTAALGGIGATISKFLKSLSEPLEGLQGMLDGITAILDGVRGCFEAYQTQLKAGTLLKIAGAIAVLTASIIAISLIDSNKLTASLASITVLFGDLMGSMAIFSKISGNMSGVTKSITAMIGMSVAIGILAGALKKIGELDPEEMVTGLVGVIGLSGTLVATAKLMNTGTSSVIKGAGQLVILAGAIKILASACADLSKLSWEQLAKGLVGVGVLMAEISIFLNTAKFSNKSISTAAGIVVLSGAIKILASSCKDFAKMDWNDIAKGLVAIGGLLTEITLFTNLTGKAEHVISTGVALIAIGAAMKIFASAVSDMATMTWEELGKGLTGVAGALLAVTAAVNFMPKNMIGIGAGLIAVSAALTILAKVLDSLGDMTWGEIARGLVALGGAMAILAVGLNVMNGTLAGSAAMLVATGALTVLTPVLSVLGAMSWESIAKGLVALAGAFTVIGVAGLVLTPLVPTILALSTALALLGVGVVGIGVGLVAAGAGLSAIAVGVTALVVAIGSGATAIVASLTVIITGIANLIPTVIGKIGEGIVEFCKVIANGAPAIGDAMKAVVLTLVDILVECIPAIADGALELITGVLDAINKYTPKIVDSLFEFLIKVLEGISKNLPNLIKASIEVIMSLFSGVIDALGDIDVDVLVKGLAGIGLISAIMLALSAVSSLIPGAMVGVLGMGVIIAELALVLAAVGALSQIPGLSWLIGEGGKLLAGIGTAIGSFVGGIVGGFMGGMSSQFPKIGSDLSSFMTNVEPFIKGAGKIDSSVMDGVKTLGAAILILTAADLLQGLTSWLTGGSSLSKFGTELAEFGPHFNKYYESIKGVNGTVVESSANAAKALAEMAKNLPNSGGVVSWFTGDNSLSTFAEELAEFGPSLKKYANSVKGLDANVVINSVNAAKALSEFAENLPNSGGIVSWFTGDNSLATFAEELAEFGPSLRKYANSVKGLDANVIINSVNAAKALSELANNLPNQGGVVSWFKGDNSLSVFAEELAKFGPVLRNYSKSVKGLDSDVVVNSVYAAKALTELADNLPSSGGLVGWFKGDYTLSKFAEELVKFGPKLKAYSDSVKGLNSGVVINSVNAAKSLTVLADNLPSNGGFAGWLEGNYTLSKFAEELVKFGPRLKAYSDSVKGINSAVVINSVNAAKSLTALADNLPSNGGIAGWLEGNYTLSKFADELVKFGPKLKEYSDSVIGVNPGIVISSVNAARALAALADNLPSNGGIAGWFEGNYTLSKFAEELSKFGPKLKEYSDSVAGLNPNIVISSTYAAKALFEMATNLPSSGGIAGWFEGNYTLSKFADELSIFGPKLKTYADSVTGLKSGVVINSTNAAMALAELATNLPSSGGLIGWFEGDYTLSAFAEELSKFGPKLKAYADSVTGLKAEVVINSANAAKALFEMANNLPSSGGMSGWFSGDYSLSSFAEELSKFGPKLKAYSDSVKGLDSTVVVNSTNAAKALFEMAANLPEQGKAINWFTGDGSLSVFAEELSKFGPVLKSYADSVTGLDANVVINSANAAKALTEMTNNLPEKGGIISWFTGDSSLSVFGDELVTFGPTLKKYADSISGLDGSVVINSANAAKALSELANNLPNSGGIVSWFTGDNDISSFGEQLVSFGKSFSAYSSSVSNVNCNQLSGVIVEFKKLVDLANSVSSIDTSGMSKFGKDLTNLGNTGIDSFINAFTNANTRVTTAATTMITTFINGVNSKKSSFTSTFTTLVQAALTAINNKQSEFNTAGSALMTKFIGGVKSQDSSSRTTFTNIISGCLTAIKNKYSEFESSGQQCMTKFIAGIKSQDSISNNAFTTLINSSLTSIKNKLSEFNSAGTDCVVKFIDGVRNKSSGVKDAFTTSVNDAVTAIRNCYNNFHSSGSYLVDGFVAGINDNTYKAVAKAKAMAKAAADAAAKELEVNSPSRVGYRIGNFFGLGFVNAIGDYVSKSYEAGSGMADAAKRGLSASVSKISDVINNDIDTQPTIKPVLDLTNIETGSRKLNVLFSRTQALSIGTSMNRTNERESLDVTNVPSRSNTFEFVQNNYSPKSLSRIEIYRQTRNQFSAMKEVISKV